MPKPKIALFARARARSEHIKVGSDHSSDSQHHYQMEEESKSAHREGEEGGESTGQEPPVLPMDSTAAGKASGGGLREQPDVWQASTLPVHKTFFSLDPNMVDAAITAIQARLNERDSNIRGTWLVTEIDHWDFERERMLLLSDNNLISVRYNFIHSAVEELKYIPLSCIVNLVYGDFKYTSSFIYTRKGKGLKVSWRTEETLGFFARWNPFNSQVPYTIFTSHVLVRKGVVNNPRMTIESVVPELERAIQDLRAAANTEQSPPGGETEGATAAEPTEFRVKNEDILFTTYFGLSASIYNQSSLGFFRRRGAVNW